jgi:hypothetical protein
VSPTRTNDQHRIAASWRLWVLVPLVLVTVGTFAVEDAVTVHLRWRVLPYQTLRLSGSDKGVSQFVYRIPAPTALDRSRGFLEDMNAAALEIASNTPWKIQVELLDADRMPIGVRAFELRSRGGAFVPVDGAPQVLASGANGVYEIALDYRVYLDPEAALEPDQPVVLVYTLMSN